MKKLVIALMAFAAFTVPGLAADMATRMPVRAAAPVAYAPSWTGFYIFGGGGGGFGNADSNGVSAPRGGLRSLAISGWAAAAGSERSAPDTTGSSALGWQVCSAM